VTIERSVPPLLDANLEDIGAVAIVSALDEVLQEDIIVSRVVVQILFVCREMLRKVSVVHTLQGRDGMRSKVAL